RNVVIVQKLYATEHSLQGPASRSRAPVAIVQEVRAVHADAEVYVWAAQKSAPVGVKQRGVGLKGLEDWDAVEVAPLEQSSRCFVKGDRQHERLTSMPEQDEGVTDQAAVKDPAKGLVQRVHGHSPGGLPIGQVAVRTVNVAERGRLEHQQLQRSRLRG